MSSIIKRAMMCYCHYTQETVKQSKKSSKQSRDHNKKLTKVSNRLID